VSAVIDVAQRNRAAPGRYWRDPQRAKCAMKTARLALLAALLFSALPAAAAWNEPNVKGTKEYRLIKLYPQARVSEYATKDYDSARMLIAYNPAADASPAVFDDIEGKVIHYAFEHKPTASVLEIYRNYETVLRAKGFDPVISGRASKFAALGLGDDDMIGYWRWEEPGKGMIWLSIRAWYQDATHDVPRSNLDIVETATIQQVLEANAAIEAKAISLVTP
jgi:hypothetical protein